MNPSQKRLVAVALIGLMLAGSIITFYYGIINGPSAGPGVFLSLSLYDVDVERRRLIDVTSILERPDVLMYLEVNAMTPPGSRWVEDMVVVFNDTMKAKRYVYVKSEELSDIARGWVSLYESRGGYPEETYSGLILRLFIFNATKGEIIFEAYDSVSYEPAEIAKGKAVKIDISLLRGSRKFAKLNVDHGHVRWYEELRAKIEEVKLDSCYVYIYRKLVVEVKPEDLLSELPQNYFSYANGRWYLKTPVLIAENTMSYSGTVSVAIKIGIREAKVGVYPTLTSGNILDKIKDGVVPSVTLWKGSGFSWGGSKYYFGLGYIVKPEKSLWIWMWARPIYRIYEVYKETCYGEEYLGDDVENVIVDILISGSTILGGIDEGLPHSKLMKAFFNGTEMILLKIPGTFLEDGDLDPGEYVAFEQIFPYFDMCGADFEVGIPAGSIAAIGICYALGLGGIACGAAIVFSSAFQLSLSAEGSTIYIDGSIYNRGDDPDIPNDYNAPEIVKVTVSKYQYKVDPSWWCFWCSPCYYKVPAGIYFKFI